MASLVGRDAELNLLRSKITAVAAGGAAGAHIVGVAGCGKTALLDAVEALAIDHGLQIRRAGARPQTLERPLGALGPALGLPPAERRRTRPVLPERAIGGAAIHSLAETAAEAVEALAMDGPLALLIDDLHFADSATNLVMNVLARRTDFALLLVVTSRPPTTGLAGLDRIDLGLFDHDTSLQFAENKLGAPASEPLAAALDAAGGNALLLEDIVFGTGMTIGERVTALPRSALLVAQALYILGDGSGRSQLASIAETTRSDVDAALEVLGSARLVRVDESGPTPRFRHELYRVAVAETITAVETRTLHGRAADLRGLFAPDTFDALEHIALAAEPGNAAAAQALRAAAADAVDTAPRAALSLLDRAIALGIDEAPTDVLTRVRAISAAGEMSAAEHLCRALLRENLPRATEREALDELAFVCFTQNRASEAVAALDRVAALADDAPTAARAGAESSFAAAVALDLAGADQRSMTALNASDDHVTQAIAGSVQCLLAVFADRLDDARALGAAAVAHAEAGGGGDARRYQPWFCAGLASAEADLLDEARGLISTGRQVAQLTGSVWAMAGYDALEALTLVRKGELDDAVAAASAVLPCIGTTDGLRVGLWAYAVLGQVALHRGDVAAARSAWTSGQGLLERGEAMIGSEQIALLQVRVLAAEGRTAEAQQQMATTWDLLGVVGMERARCELGVDLVRLSLATGDRDRASAIAEALSRGAVRATAPTTRIDAARAQLLIDPTTDNARAVLAAAIAGPRRLLAAIAMAEAGAVLAKTGSDEGTDCLVEAARVFVQQGADADLATIAHLLPAGAAARRSRSGWSALTSTERAVLKLVADGLPNTEIAKHLAISRRTVESHVSATYRKLNVRTRVDLARAALDHRVTG